MGEDFDYWGPVASQTRPIPAASTEIECVTQHPDEPAGPDFHAICRGTADLIATSIHCPSEAEGECGGHPICRPCWVLCVEKGML